MKTYENFYEKTTSEIYIKTCKVASRLNSDRYDETQFNWTNITHKDYNKIKNVISFGQ